MSNILIFDTETTTFPNPDRAPDHPKQARVIQLAAILVDKDFKELGSVYSLIKPDGWTIQEGAFKAHGISQETCEKDGRDIVDVMRELAILWNEASIWVGHNIQFDLTMIEIEFACLLSKKINLAVKVPRKDEIRCTMNASTDICKLPFATPEKFGKKYKWPKLSEAYQHFFNEPLEGAHDALADVRACIRVYKHLSDSKLL